LFERLSAQRIAMIGLPTSSPTKVDAFPVRATQGGLVLIGAAGLGEIGGQSRLTQRLSAEQSTCAATKMLLTEEAKLRNGGGQ
jgi:hypothetical protein